MCFFSKFFFDTSLTIYFFISPYIYTRERIACTCVTAGNQATPLDRHCLQTPCLPVCIHVYTVQKRGNRSRRCMHLARIYTVNRCVERSKQHTCARDKRDRARRRARSPRSVSRLSHRAGSKGPVQDTEASTQEA